MFNRLKVFFEEARQEIKHVNWPTRKEAIRLTLIVVGISLFLAVFLGVFDGLFAALLQTFVL